MYCNWDDPRISSFILYLSYSFGHLGRKKLVIAYYQNQECDLISRHDSDRAIWLKYNGNRQGGRVPGVWDIGIRESKGEWDFHSKE